LIITWKGKVVFTPFKFDSKIFQIKIASFLYLRHEECNYFFQVVFAGNPGEFAVILEDPAVKNIFKLKQLPSEYNYYYTGRSNLPYAVIGIDPKYTLNSKHWNKIESADQIIKKIDHLMPIENLRVIYGRILDRDNNQIGLWFSEYYHTIIIFGTNNRLTVYSPYQPNDRI